MQPNGQGLFIACVVFFPERPVQSLTPKYFIDLGTYKKVFLEGWKMSPVAAWCLECFMKLNCAIELEVVVKMRW